MSYLVIIEISWTLASEIATGEGANKRPGIAMPAHMPTKPSLRARNVVTTITFVFLRINLIPDFRWAHYLITQYVVPLTQSLRSVMKFSPTCK